MFISNSLVQRFGRCHRWNKLDFTSLQRIIHQRGFGAWWGKVASALQRRPFQGIPYLPLKHASVCPFWVALCFHWMGYLSSEVARENVKCFSCFWLEWLGPLFHLNLQKHKTGTWKFTVALLKTFPSRSSRWKQSPQSPHPKWPAHYHSLQCKDSFP